MRDIEANEIKSYQLHFYQNLISYLQEWISYPAK